MSCEAVLNYLKESNSYVESSLVDSFINPLIVKYLPLYVIEYCVLNQNVQEVLLKLSENELYFASQIIKYAEMNGQDWITLCAQFIHLLDNSNYKDLVLDLRDKNINDDFISKFLFLTNNGGNFYNIKTVDDIYNFDNVRLAKINEYSNTSDPNLIMLMKYGISYDKAFNYYKRYGKDVSKLPDCIEKDFLLDISNLIEGKGTSSNTFDDFLFICNIDSRLRNMFAKIYNEQFYQISNDKFMGNYVKEGVSVPVYDAGVDFVMSIYSYGLATDLNIPDNYKNDWLRPRVSVDYMCNSIISSVNMRTSIKHCVYGFSNYSMNDLALLGANDLGTGGIYKEVNVTNPYHNDKLIADVEFRVPDMLINNTRFTNNEVYRKRRKLVNGRMEKILPDYIVYFKKEDDYLNDPIWLESFNAAKDFQIPIVLVDCEKCLQHNVMKIDNLMEQFVARYDDIDSIRNIIEMIYSLKSGYNIAPSLINKYLGTEKLYSYVYMIVNHLEEMVNIVPSIALKGIDEFLNVLDEEYEKILKSPYWLEYARNQGYSVDKPNDVIQLLNNVRNGIVAKYGIKENVINH